MPLTKNDRILWMDALRGVLIIVVILYHSMNRIQKYEPEALAPITIFNGFFDPVRMPVLVLLSGLLLARSLRKPPREFVKGKLRSLLWPYIVWVLISVSMLLLPGATEDRTAVPEMYVRALTGQGTYMWFLLFLFTFYILSLVIPPAIHSWLIIPTLIVSQLINFAPHWAGFFYLLAMFWTGALLHKPLSENRKWVRPARWIGVAAFVCIGIGSSTGLSVKYEPLYAPLVVAAALGLTGIAQALVGTILGKLLTFIGKSTVTYYVTHYVTIMVVYFIASRALNIGDELLLFTLCVLASLLIGYAAQQLRKHPMVGWLFEFPSRPKRSQPGTAEPRPRPVK